MSINCPGGTIYSVQPGDTFFRIAERFGVTVADLIAANPQIIDPNVIQVGQPICVPRQPAPSCPGFIYVIQAGDTLFALARRFGVSVRDILAFNPGIDPQRLFIGQEICIPTGQPARRCVILSATDIAPNAESAAYINPSTGRVVAFVTNVPRPEQLPGGGVYKLYLFGPRELEELSVTTMTEALPGLWVANVTGLPFPLTQLQSILITSERPENVGPPQGLGVATTILIPPPQV